MRLRILIVPLLLILILVLCIGYIKPDFDEILVRKTAIDTQDKLIAKVDSTINNIATLDDSLNKEKESEYFLWNYLPSTMNQEQAIDTFNYLASQSGLIVLDMNLKKEVETAMNVAPDGSIIENSAPKAKNFQFTGSILGKYEDIKAFFNQLVHVNRFQSVQLFSIQKNDQLSATENSTDLKGTFVVEYGYFPNKSIDSALDMPVFSHTSFNFSQVNALRTKIISVPPFERGVPGKPNPFQ